MPRNYDHNRKRESARPDKYIVEKDLGGKMGGMNAGILIVRDRRNRHWVEKRIPEDLIRAGVFKEECRKMMRMRHKNICLLHEVYQSPNRTRGSMWLEYCDAGDFHSVIQRHAQVKKKIGERFLWKLFYQVADALRYCHGGPSGGKDKRWSTTVHRDLKPDNVLLKWEGNSTPEVKLADFGIAADASTNFQSSGSTPSQYASPEMKCGLSGPESDVYQLGGVLYSAMTLGRSPYEAKYDWTTMGYTNHLIDAVSQCTNTDAHKRPVSVHLSGHLQALYKKISHKVLPDGELLTK